MDRSIGLSSAPAEMAGLYQAGPVGSGPVEPVVERPARSAAWSSRPGWVDSMRVGVATEGPGRWERARRGSGADDAHRRVPIGREDMMQCALPCASVYRVARRTCAAVRVRIRGRAT